MKDGGPAFPGIEGANGHGNQIPTVTGADGSLIWASLHPGMSLRDYFAAKAMTGYLSCQDFMNEMCRELGSKEDAFERVAGYSYAQADAMLAERAKGGGA